MPLKKRRSGQHTDRNEERFTNISEALNLIIHLQWMMWRALRRVGVNVKDMERSMAIDFGSLEAAVAKNTEVDEFGEPIARQADGRDPKAGRGYGPSCPGEDRGVRGEPCSAQ